MSLVYLIRHGQASFMEKNYDRLSELGQHQSRKLGQWFLSEGISFDQLFCGTLQRQIDTWKLSVGSELSVSMDACFNEHEGLSIFKDHFPSYLSTRSELATAVKSKGAQDPTVRKGLVKAFFQMHHMWVQGEIESGEHESWKSFKERSVQAYSIILSAAEKGHLALFTSGGMIAALLGQILDINDEKIVDINWQIRNTSITELKLSSGRLMLREFNTTPHLSSEEVSYV